MNLLILNKLVMMKNHIMNLRHLKLEHIDQKHWGAQGESSYDKTKYIGDYGGYNGGGAGGSSYIGNLLLSDKVMYCFGCEESTESSTRTIANTCHSSTPTENCAKEGNGYVRITLIS